MWIVFVVIIVDFVRIKGYVIFVDVEKIKVKRVILIVLGFVGGVGGVVFGYYCIFLLVFGSIIGVVIGNFFC